MEIKPKQLTVIGPSDWFTGAVRIDTIVQLRERSTLNVAAVHFTPDGTHRWNTDDGGRTLYVTEGEGRIRSRTEPVFVVRDTRSRHRRRTRRRLLRIGVATSRYDAAALRQAGADHVLGTLEETLQDQQLAHERR